MTSVYSSCGNFTRSVSELGLTNVEQQRMLRSNNVITTKMMSEKDARASEARDLQDKANTQAFKVFAADQTKQAAQIAFIGSILNLVGTLVKGIGSQANGKSSWFDVAADGLNGLGTVITKYLDYLKAGAEKEATEEDLKRINQQRCGSDQATRALDTNPYV